MRLHKRLYLAFIALIGIPLMLLGMSVSALLIALNLPNVQNIIEQKLPSLTGNMVHLEGVSGFLPAHLRVEKLTLEDEKGIWLELDHADLKWSPLALLHLQAKVNDFKTERFIFERLPYSSKPKPPEDPHKKPLNLPLGIRIDRLVAPHIEIGPELAKKRVMLSLLGKAYIKSINPFFHNISLKNLPNMRFDIQSKRLDEPGQLFLNLDKKRHHVTGTIHFDEGKNGFVSLFGQMPALDPLTTDIMIDGPFRKLKINLSLLAGDKDKAQLSAHSAGMVNLYKKEGQLALTLKAPSMNLRSDLGWDQLDVEAALKGSLKAPQGQAFVKITNLAASSVAASSIDLQFKGISQKTGHIEEKISLLGAVSALKIPGNEPLLLASSPLTLKAIYKPFNKTQPFEVQLSHELAQLHLNGTLAPALKAHLDLALPSLRPFAKLGKIDLEGSTHLTSDIVLPQLKNDPLDIVAAEHINIKSGLSQAVDLIGKKGELNLHVQRNAQGVIDLKTLHVTGQALDLKGLGQFDLKNAGAVESSISLNLPQLKALHPALRGGVDLNVKTSGPLKDIKTNLTLNGKLGVDHTQAHIKEGPLTLKAEIDHLPNAPKGKLNLTGTFDNAPLTLDALFDKDSKGNLAFSLNELGWKSLKGKGDIALPYGKKIPRGNLALSIPHLEAFAPIIGQPIKGALTLALHTEKKNDGELRANNVRLDLSSRLAMADYGVRSLKIRGEATHLSEEPNFDLMAQLEGLKAKDITGNLKTTVKGPQNALSLNVSGRFQNLLKAPAQLDLSALADLTNSYIKLQKFSALVKGETMRLLSPAAVKYGVPLAIEHLKLSVSARNSKAAQLSVNGTIKPKLDLSFGLDNLTPALANPFVPSLKAEGIVRAKGVLKGSVEDPTGNIVLSGKNLRLTSGPGASLPAAFFDVRTQLDHKKAVIKATATAGQKLSLNADGSVPLSKDGAISLRSKGKLDLTMANAILGASGMGLKGHLALDILAQGKLPQPQLSGAVHLRDGAFDHYAQGVHLTQLHGDILAQGDKLTIQDLTLQAGKGTMSLTGQIGALRPAIPIDLEFKMDKAQPVISDILEETLDAAIHIYGQATSKLNIDGKIKIPQASISIPNSMPASVPELEIVQPVKKQAQKLDPPMVIGLNLDVISPGKLFVRGHGLFAEMNGKLHVGGVSSAPVISGGFNLKQGTFNLAGVNLTFTKGLVAFNGSGVGHRLDPTLDFKADRSAEGILASLLVTGYASAPKINFMSVPERPKDEVLSVLLFGSSRASLSPTQLAALGAAVVQLGGGTSFDPLGTVRSGLGLDELSIGGGDDGNGKSKSTLTAGKYIFKNVYVGAKEGLSGSNTQAEVRIDLTKHLKLNTTVGTGGQITGFTTPENDPGSSVGLSYGTDY
ncbi:translocation/assembly module TamB domain-containing protein [Aristophania vespae]|uniref:translocation/assembly module TamB domain-containing protein n=1 Tax=Aristophania vespae TaxID=2697033 RepID=UPI00235132B8|nr:translocation/assembly module TamB domain-containing protein [Aristophania vespae]UMM63288.1 hypothetical protein DM15PD_02460 [Aristophania vespae]